MAAADHHRANNQLAEDCELPGERGAYCWVAEAEADIAARRSLVNYELERE